MTDAARYRILNPETKKITDCVLTREELLMEELSGNLWLSKEEWEWLVKESLSPFSIPIYWNSENFVDESGVAIVPFTRRGILDHFCYPHVTS